MILADTSIWVQHFRRGMPLFAAALGQHQISMHALFSASWPVEIS